MNRSDDPVDTCVWSTLAEHSQIQLHGKKLTYEHAKEDVLQRTSLDTPGDEDLQFLIFDQNVQTIIIKKQSGSICKYVILLVMMWVGIFSYAQYPDTKRFLNVAEYSAESNDSMTQIRPPVTKKEYLSHAWATPDEIIPVELEKWKETLSHIWISPDELIFPNGTYNWKKFQGIFPKGVLQLKSSKKRLFYKMFVFEEVVAEFLIPYLLPKEHTFYFQLSSTVDGLPDQRFSKNGFLFLRDVLEIEVFAITKWEACLKNRNDTYLECHRNRLKARGNMCNETRTQAFCEKITEEPCDNIYTYLVRMITLDYILGHPDRMSPESCLSTNLFRQIQSSKKSRYVLFDNNASNNRKKSSLLKRLISTYCIFDEDILKRAHSHFHNFTLVNSTMTELMDIMRVPEIKLAAKEHVYSVKFDFDAFTKILWKRVKKLFEMKEICMAS